MGAGPLGMCGLQCTARQHCNPDVHSDLCFDISIYIYMYLLHKPTKVRVCVYIYVHAGMRTQDRYLSVVNQIVQIVTDVVESDVVLKTS